jgi:hypothetical protein
LIFLSSFLVELVVAVALQILSDSLVLEIKPLLLVVVKEFLGLRFLLVVERVSAEVAEHHMVPSYICFSMVETASPLVFFIL